MIGYIISILVNIYFINNCDNKKSDNCGCK